MQIKIYALERYDVDFDLPEASCPSFRRRFFYRTGRSWGMFRRKYVSINNYYRLFKDILTPVQLDGLRLLLTPFPKSIRPTIASPLSPAWG